MSRRADPRHGSRPARSCLVAGLTAGLLLAGAVPALGVVTPTPVSPTPVTPTTTTALAPSAAPAPAPETWSAELALDGGDDSGLVLGDGGVRLAGPAAPGAPSEGVLTLAPRRLLAPTPGLVVRPTIDLPAGTGATGQVTRVDVQARALDAAGTWGAWLPAPAGAPVRFAAATTEVQLRVLLHGPTGGATTPVVRSLWVSALPAAVTTTASPAAATSTTATTDPAAPAAKPLWDGAIATDGLGGFKDTPYNITGSSTVVVVPGPPKSIRFTVPGGSQRAEIEPDVPEFTEGQTRYFRLTYTLPADFPANPDGFQLATQWKNDGTGSPPLELRIEKGRFVLGGGYGRPGGSRLFSTDIAPVVTGRPADIVVGILFSSDPGKGRVDVWLDGQQRVTGYRPPGGTLYPGLDSYWKVGLYRDTGLDSTATADLSVARMGATYASVTGRS